MKYELLDRPIAFHGVFKRFTGSTNATLLLSQIIYWSNRTTDPNGWFYKTGEDFEEETTLTRKEQLTARNILKQLGWLEEELKGVPATLYFRLTKKFDDLLKSGFDNRAKLVSTGGRNLIVPPVKTISENTSKTTKTPCKSPEAGDNVRAGFFKPNRKPVASLNDAEYVLRQVRWLARKWNNRAAKFDGYYRHVKVVESTANIAAVKKLIKEARQLKVDWKEFVIAVFVNVEATMRKYHNCSSSASQYFTFPFILRPKEFTLLYEAKRNWVIDNDRPNRQSVEEPSSVSQAVGENDPRNPYAKRRS